MPELLHVFGIRPRWRGIDRLRIIKIPVPAQLHSFFGGDHIMAGRDLENALKQRASLMPAKSYAVINRFAIPTGGYSSGEEGFNLGSQIQRSTMERIKEGFNAKSVAGGEDSPIYAVPKHQGKLSPEPLQAVSAKILIQMQGNFTIRTSSQPMPCLFELVLDRLVAVVFAVDNDLKLFVLIGDLL